MKEPEPTERVPKIPRRFFGERLGPGIEFDLLVVEIRPAGLVEYSAVVLVTICKIDDDSKFPIPTEMSSCLCATEFQRDFL